MSFACRSTLLVLAVIAGHARVATAQRPPLRGDIVRLHRLTAHGDTESIVARWHLASRDSIVVGSGRSDSGAVVVIPRSALAGIDVERGGQAETAAIATFAIAGGVASGVAAIKWCLDDIRACDDQRTVTDCDTTSRWSLPALLAVGGAIVGGLIGEAIAPRRYWEPVLLPTELGATPDGRLRWQMLVGVRLPIRRRASY